MSQQSKTTPATIPLERALDQNELVKDSVAQSANELFVINAVLKQELPNAAQSGEVVKALHKTDELEIRIQESVKELAQVNQLLEQEISERADLECELANTKSALDRAKNSQSV